MVPNIDGKIGHKIKTRKQPKHGTQPKQLHVFGPRLYNLLPKYRRDIESVKTEKF